MHVTDSFFFLLLLVTLSKFCFVDRKQNACQRSSLYWQELDPPHSKVCVILVANTPVILLTFQSFVPAEVGYIILLYLSVYLISQWVGKLEI